MRETLSKLIADLRKAKPDFEAITFDIRELSLQVGRPNRIKAVKPTIPDTYINEIVSQIRAEFVKMEDACLKRDAPKALQHAEAALRKLD